MPSAAIVVDGILINSQTDDFPFGNPASILKLDGGGFMVCWSESTANDGSGGCVQARIYDANGVPTGPQFILNTTTQGTQAIPDAVQLADGNIMVTWQDGSNQGVDNAPSSIKGQIFTAAGVKIGGEFLVNTVIAGSQSFPTSTLLDNDNVMILWVDNGGSDGNLAGIKGQIVDATGAKIGGEFLVNTNTTGAQSFPNVAILNNGNVIVTWQDLSGTLGDSSQSIKAQILDASGNKVGDEFLVNTETTGVQNLGQVAVLENGNFVVTWQDASAIGGDTSSSGIKAQMFDAAGNKIGGEFLVNTTTLGLQSNPAITAMSNGSFIIAWIDRGPPSQDPNQPPQQVHRAQVYSADGTAIGAEFIAHHDDGAGEIIGSPMIADLGDNQFIITGTVATLSNTVPPVQLSQGLQGNIFVLLNQLIGTGIDETISGTAGADFIDGKGGADILSGLEGNDIVNGGDGDDMIDGGLDIDQLYGEAGNDTLDAGNGSGLLSGGSGDDRLILRSGGSDSDIDGGSGTDTLVIADRIIRLDSLVGIEGIEFASPQSLTITGTQFSTGLAANATISGTGTLRIDMDTPGDFISKLLNVGSGVSLIVNGTGGADILKLGNSTNTVGTGDGTDQIKGGNLVDTINGGDGVDKINGSGGADILTGGGGNDVFKYTRVSDSGTGAAVDRITDFEIGNDRINLTAIDTNASLPGVQGFGFAGTAAFSGGGAAQVRYEDSGADLLVQADTDGDGDADMEIILEGLAGQTLTAASFNLGSASEPLPKNRVVMDDLSDGKAAPPVAEAPVSSASTELQTMQGQLFMDRFGDSEHGLIRYYKDNNVMMGPLEVI